MKIQQKKGDMIMTIQTITKENFSAQVKDAKVPVLIDLWAPWCVYCRRLSPVLDRLADKYGDEILIGKINVDEQPELANLLDASVIPTLYLYQNGEHGEKIVAPGSQAQLEEWIKDQLAE